MRAWLRCRLDPGMFSDEFVVTYPADKTRNWLATIFAHSSCVRVHSEHEGEVLVTLVGDEYEYAVLPSDGIILKPPKADLSLR